MSNASFEEREHARDQEMVRTVHNTARYFTEKRQVAWVALVFTLLWGVYGYLKMPKAKDPLIEVRVAVAACTWPGAEAQKIEQLVVRLLGRPDELVELQLERRRVAVLRALDEEDHQERDDGGAGVDDELPGVREAEQRPRQSPDGDGPRGEPERRGLPGRASRRLREPAEPALRMDRHAQGEAASVPSRRVRRFPSGEFGHPS